MKRGGKQITGVSTTSIVGLKALLAQEKAARAGKPTSSPAPVIASETTNKGVTDRAKKDTEPETRDSKPKKITMIGGIAYALGEDNDWEPLVDTERKAWEEYERSEIWEKRGSHFNEGAQSRPEEEEEEMKRTQRRELISELSEDTEKGREEHRAQLAKRERDKMTRLELIQAKSAKVKPLTPSAAVQTPNESLKADDKTESAETDPKRRKLSESS